MTFTFLFAMTLAVLANTWLENRETSHTVVVVDLSHEPTQQEATQTEISTDTYSNSFSPIELDVFPETEEIRNRSYSLPSGDAALFCDSIDLINRPEDADDMVKVASAAYGTPSGLLNGIWHTESHHGINGQTGTCRVMDQYAIRDCWKPGKRTRRPSGCESPYIFAGETASETRWKEPRGDTGNGTRQKMSVTRVAKALGINAWSIKGSCGRSQLSDRPENRPTFGGCFGNMQITPSEWEADVLAMGYELSELSPFNVCDSLLVSSYRLKKHHDQRLKKFMKDAYWQKRETEADQRSWLWAGRRYYGRPEGSSSNRYERHFKHGRASASFQCGWNCWDKMEESGDFTPLISYIQKRGKHLR